MEVNLERIDGWRVRIPIDKSAGMRVPGMIYADQRLLESILKDKAVEQVMNVACLPGIVRQSMAMPDMHWGYGFPIGGVAATDPKEGGVVSPGGVGFDINCGVRLVRSDLGEQDVRPRLKELVAALFRHVPSGLGSKSALRLSLRDERRLLARGARWAVEQGFGTDGDLEATEDYGCIAGADPEVVSQRAYDRGRNQIGTLGSGNHFLEVQVVDEIYEPSLANTLNIFEGQVTVMIHCGSRGLGYQVCDEYCKQIGKTLEKYKIRLPDRQLACAPVDSPEGRQYLAAMRGAANYAWGNRQYIMHRARQSFEKTFGRSWQDLGLHLVYDVAHNIAKIENHEVDGRQRSLCVHRKGATRAFPPGHPELPAKYRPIGQPVIIPGDMGRNSYLLIGVAGAAETFYSCCHGAGRVMSRSKAKKTFKFQDLIKELEDKGIVIQAQSRATVTEEAPGVYKNVTEVVDVVENAGLAKKVCRLKPIGVVKG